MEANLCELPIKLDSKQTRRMHLAGTVSFPNPFPALGHITIEKGSFLRSPIGDPVESDFVVVREKADLEQAASRLVRSCDVAAIFFAGQWAGADDSRNFEFLQDDCAHDLELGEWFLGPVKVGEINETLKLDISCIEAGARGIIFVPENSPVLTKTEIALTAAAASELTPAMPRCERTRHDAVGCEYW